MLGWIKKMTNPPAEPPDGVPAAWRKAVQARADTVQAVLLKHPGVATDLMAWVLRGESQGVLADIATQHQSTLPALGLESMGMKLAEVDSLYGEFDAVPAPMMLRWAQVLGAALQNRTWGLVLKNTAAPLWCEALLIHDCGISLGSFGHDPRRSRHLTAARVERLLVEAGLPASTLLQAVFTSGESMRYGGQDLRSGGIRHWPDYEDALLRHAEALEAAMRGAAVDARLIQLEMLDRVGPGTLARFAEPLVEFAVSSSKQVRAEADALVVKLGNAAIAPLERLAKQGKPEARGFALKLLWALGRREFALESAAADKAASVRALAESWKQAPDPAAEAAWTLPEAAPRAPIAWAVRSTAALEAALAHLLPAVSDAVERENQSVREQNTRRQWQQPLSNPMRRDEFDAIRRHVQSDAIAWNGKRLRDPSFAVRYAADRLAAFAQDPAANLVALAKLLDAFGVLGDERRGLHGVAVRAFEAMHDGPAELTLDELAAVLDPMGLGADALLRACVHSYGGLARAWPPEHVAAFHARHVDALEAYLRAPLHDYQTDRAQVYQALASLPRLPPRTADTLFEIALGSARSERALARATLAHHPDKETRIVAALASGKAEVRALAAQWLRELAHDAAVPALETAVAKEKNDVAKGAMLDALQAMGRPVERYLDREHLAEDARKTLAKGVPKELAWVRWEAMPAVRWDDTGATVAEETLRGLIVQAMKQKSPEPNAVLRKYCAMLRPQDREALGQWLLDSWLVEDVRPIPAEEALRRAVQGAQSTHQSMQSHPQYWKDNPLFGKGVEELQAAMLPAHLRTPAGSAIDAKGVLAVAAACAGERAAASVARYLKEYYGTRAAQGKALIAMLAWIDHPTATQLMLSIGSRFRTKSFQEEATRQAEALAERRGWTLAELADRTMPSAGFDEHGVLDLSFGERHFSARLLPDFKIELRNPDGKTIASLPEPRQDDDAERAAEAKKALSGAKKELKSIVALQTDRLYEALCTERDWPAEDWERYLNRHPVVRRLCQRLVWIAMRDDAVLFTFRPLDDGTLTDVDDEAVVLPADARVRLAHDTRLDAALSSRWQQHLLDYAVTPLFQQLGKGSYALPADKQRATELLDFEGHLLEAFALRGRALKLGYTRGATQDGGWFFSYEKRFPTLGLQAVIEFSGNGLPEENRTVALHKLMFTSAQSDTWQSTGLALGKIPAVLLSECWNDLRLIAADGSGFDPDWKKKSEY